MDPLSFFRAALGSCALSRLGPSHAPLRTYFE
jgi:hypothetical protein